MLLQTDSLYLRNLRPEDVPIIHAYRNDPACAKYQRWEDTSLSSVSQFAETFHSCRFLSKQEEQHYAVCLHDGTFVGDLSYFYTEADSCVTLGITVKPEYQHQGIAREILQAVVKSVQKQYPRLDLVALIDPENTASIRLFERLGFYRECYAETIRSFVYMIDGVR